MMLTNHRAGAQRSEAARVAILSAAASLFVSSGYERLAMEGIASAAKVGKQTIYRWWPSKSALIAECLADGYLLPNDRFDPPTSGHVVDDIASWYAGVADYFQSENNNRLLLSLISAAAGDPDVAAHFDARFGGGHTIEARIQQGIKAGELRPDVPMNRVAEALIGALLLRVLARSPIEPTFAADMVNMVLSPSTIEAQTRQH
ncbi:TetR/AcrR family transcriptional regulator [Arthrobacter sp. 9AX]|uniref:TetR/AcrR family transcriptional regulator n=1 Tax=Arthrobacter sp. 9AX TaxID=2653131 RepID=UPI0012F11097|nr:TetR/AcrR family transcriptional regulator [Arthrobacter sp. 9AX]VXB03478.1 TetR/AcrR family transcriptional regulator [Arthrobacter sp. 9AX]